MSAMTRLLDTAKRDHLFIFHVVLVRVVCCAVPLQAGVIGNPAKLEAVIQAYRANQHLLKTWHGTAEIHTRANSPETGERETAAEVDFSYDESGESPAFSFFWRYQSSTRHFEGEHLEDQYAGVHMGGFMRDEKLTSYGPFKTGRENVVQSIKIAPNEKKVLGGMSDFFDPRFYFSTADEQTDLYLETLVRQRSEKWLILELKQEKSIVSVKMQNRQIQNSKTLIDFDLSQGGGGFHSTLF